jgi:peptidyl-prolyl cis-trans isomerase C
VSCHVRTVPSRIGIAALILGVGVSAGCSKSPAPADVAPTTSASAKVALSDELRARVLARVGERVITLGEYADTLARMDPFERQRYQTPSRRKLLLDEMINTELLAEEARRRGLDKLPETQELVRIMLRDEALADLRAKLPPLEAIPAAEIGAYYDAHVSEFTEPERRRIAAIVVSSKVEADQVLTEARRATPEQWGALVRKHSGATKNQTAGMPPALELEGDLGFVTHPSSGRGEDEHVPEPVREVAFQLPSPGSVHPEPVAALGKFYVVQLVAINAPHKRSREEADRAIRVAILQDKARAAQAALEKELLAKIPVQIDQAALAKVAVPAPASSR